VSGLDVRPAREADLGALNDLYSRSVTHDQGRRGVGRALYDALFEALETEDVHRAYAGITLPNDASVGLHERFGFRPVGVFDEVGRKFGRYWSVGWYEKDLAP
jgi:phosphinothricin acetyltransferase